MTAHFYKDFSYPDEKLWISQWWYKSTELIIWMKIVEFSKVEKGWKDDSHLSRETKCVSTRYYRAPRMIFIIRIEPAEICSSIVFALPVSSLVPSVVWKLMKRITQVKCLTIHWMLRKKFDETDFTMRLYRATMHFWTFFKIIFFTTVWDCGSSIV